MKVKQVMSYPAICIDHKASIEEAIKIMEEKDVGFLPVTKNDYLVGVVIDRDILLRGKDKKSNTYIEKIMTKDNLICINMNDDLLEAAKIMSNYKIRRLIVTEDNLIKGVITSKDLLYQDDLIPYIKQTYINMTY